MAQRTGRGGGDFSAGGGDFGLRATLLGTSGTAIPNNAALIIAGPQQRRPPRLRGVDTGLLVALRVHFT